MSMDSQSFEKVVEAFCIEHNLVNFSDKLVIACSGGPDSMALISVFEALAPKYNLSLFVAHAEHGIREQSSLDDANYVKNYCKEHHLPFFLEHLNIKNKLDNKRESVETLARRLRYEFLRKVALQVDSKKIVTAHHLNDQAETVLQHLLRGAGADGLIGMKPINNGIIRPFLSVYREDIERYCLDKNIKTCIDETNSSLEYERNRIRLDLIPRLKQYNPNVVTAICNSAKIIEQEHDFILFYVKKLYNSCRVIDNEFCFKKSLILNEHKAIRLAFYRYIITKIQANLENIGFTHIDKIDKFLYNGHTGAFLQLPKKLRVKINYDEILFYKESKILPKKQYNIAVGMDMQVDLPYNKSITIKKITRADLWSLSGNDHCFIDADKIRGTLVIRNRKDGDRITPKGMKGNKKIKDIFIDNKIPVDKRCEIPLVCDDESIVWIAGIQQNAHYILDENSNNILYLKLKNNN